VIIKSIVINLKNKYPNIDNMNNKLQTKLDFYIPERKGQFNPQPVIHQLPNYPPSVESMGTYNSLNSIPVKINDDSPYDRKVKNYHGIIRRKRFCISNLHRIISTDTPAKFSVTIQEGIDKIRYIRLIKLTVNYTQPALSILNGFVNFPDFHTSETISDNNKYHGFFPVIQGVIGNPVLFSYEFSEDYITEFIQLDNLQTKLRIEVYKENSSNGKIEPFTDLTSFSIEFEIGYIDPAYKLEQELRGH
jgi:hypothetical protein